MSYEETFEHKGFTIRLSRDELADSPAEFNNEERFLVGFHRDFHVQFANERDGRYGDNSLPVIRSADDAFWYLPKDAILKHLIEEEGYEPEDAQDEADAGHVSGWRMFQLNAYIHSGVALSLGEFGCPWDSGQVGWVFVKEDNGWGERDGKPITHEQIAQWLVEEWNQFLSGDVWVFTVEDSDGDVLESCGMIYGMEDALEAAKAECPPASATKEVPVKILHTDGTWAQATGTVPVYVGDSKAPEWLMQHSCGEDGWRNVEEIIISAAKAAKESVA